MNTIIFKNELLFRISIINNKDIIDKIYVYEDNLDNIIFFYCFTINNTIFAAKETSNNNYSYYQKIYNSIKNELELNAIIDSQFKLILSKK